MKTEMEKKADKAFSRILKAGYIEVNAYELSGSQFMTVFNKEGKYRILIEHANGYQVFDEIGSHLTSW